MGCACSNTCVTSIDAHPQVTSNAEAQAERDFHLEFALKKKLGQGSYGVVYAATRTDGSNEQLAVKVVDLRDPSCQHADFDHELMRLDPSRQRTAANEAAMLSAASGHSNVCRIADHFVHGGLAYIVLGRYCRTLRKALDSQATLSEETMRPFLKGMLRGIVAVHARRLVHRDIKPDNFMCHGPDNTVKLCDFGLACALPSVQENTTCTGVFGTPPYMAPEMLQNRGYGAKVDVWSFGVVVHCLLRGSFPYSPVGMTRASMQERILQGIPRPEIFLEEFDGSHRGSGGSSDAARRFIVSMLSRNVATRPTASQALRGEFFASASLSRSCLRRKLDAAHRCGAFDDTDAKKADVREVDLRLRHLQARRQQPAVSKVRPLLSDTSTTDAGSALAESGQSSDRE